MADELIDALNAADSIAARTRAGEAEYVAPHPALDALASLVRQAPLQCVAIAFLIGVAVARRR
jgi:hypothetical protein